MAKGATKQAVQQKRHRQRRRRPKSGRGAGAVAKNYPLPDRWKVDWDYVGQLSADEREWLAEFGDCYYKGDFRFCDPDDWSREDRSDVNRSKNSSRTDAHGLAEIGVCGGGGLDALEDHDDLRGPQFADIDPTPAYLNGQEYKAALAEYRKHLAPGRKVAEPEVTVAYMRALVRLRKSVPNQDDSDDEEERQR